MNNEAPVDVALSYTDDGGKSYVQYGVGEKSLSTFVVAKNNWGSWIFLFQVLYTLLFYKVCFRVTIDIEEYFRLLMMIVGSTMNT